MTSAGLPLISVVVPIYNVQEYLKQCVDSIRYQTYQNLEIILVDDGSPDECGKIIDEYALEDQRIVCLHKKNGGLSSARNAGKAMAKGDYIAFIDSDDYIHSRFIETLLSDITKNEADISACFFNSFIRESVDTEISPDETVQVFSGGEAIHEMYRSDGIGWNAWNKLYRTRLFDGIDYPEGVICEDKATAYKLFLKSERVTYRDTELYHYRIRENSISGQRSKKYYLDSFMINEQMERDLENSGIRTLGDLAKSYTAKSGFMDYSETFDRPGYEEIKETARQGLIRNYRYLKVADYLSLLQKTAIYLGGLSARYGRGVILKLLCLAVRAAGKNRSDKLT